METGWEVGSASVLRRRAKCVRLRFSEVCWDGGGLGTRGVRSFKLGFNVTVTVDSEPSLICSCSCSCTSQSSIVEEPVLVYSQTVLRDVEVDEDERAIGAR